MKTNVKLSVAPAVSTFNGGKGPRNTPERHLARTVMTCMLWEDTFYEDGQTIADRIRDLVPKVAPERVVEIARYARQDANIRHASLLLARELLRHPTATSSQKREAISSVIQRADEPAEFLAIYWKDKRAMVPKAARLGITDALNRFDEYQLGKYNRKEGVKLRDVLRMVHPVPSSPAQSLLYKAILDDTLKTPDTWEVQLSGGADKGVVFSRLLSEGKLGYLATLRNLRNMEASGVNRNLIRERLATGDKKVFPYHFLSALKHAPWAAEYLNAGLLASTSKMEKLSGSTAILVDLSGSMHAPVSGKSEVMRHEAASALAIQAREISEDCDVYAFSTYIKQVKPYRGLALIDAIQQSGVSGGTNIGACLAGVKGKYERIIVITDEQSTDAVMAPKVYGADKGYIVNVAPYQNGIGYGDWVRVDGWSEQTIRFIQEYEKNNE